MRLIFKDKKSFSVNEISIVEVLKYLAPRADNFEVVELNSYEGENYYYTEDIENMQSVLEIIGFLESKENLFANIFSIKINEILIDIEDDYSLSAFSEDASNIETFTKRFCSEFLKYEGELVDEIIHLDGKYAMVDLGIIIKEFLTFDEYLEEMK